MPDERDNNPQVAIILLNWNGVEDTIACIHSLQRLTYATYRIVVVDNASLGGDADRLQLQFGNTIDVVRNTENEGFAAGNNTGIRWADQKYRPKFFWLLNNDTTVDPNALDALLGHIRSNPGQAIIGSTILSSSDRIYCLGGGTINFWTGIDRLWGARKLASSAFVPKRFSYISGCSLFFRREVLVDVEGFAPEFFLYSEEADFCLRATRSGHQLGFAPKSVVYHKGSRSSEHLSPTYIYYFLRNKLLFMKRNAHWWQWVTFFPVFLVYYCGGFLLIARRLPLGFRFRLILLALQDHFASRFGRQPVPPLPRPR